MAQKKISEGTSKTNSGVNNRSFFVCSKVVKRNVMNGAAIFSKILRIKKIVFRERKKLDFFSLMKYFDSLI